MTIECYYASCSNHESNRFGDDAGPYCDLNECTATEDELVVYKLMRRVQLHKADLAHDDVDLIEPPILDDGRWPLCARLFWLLYAALMAVAIGTIVYMFNH